MKRSLTRSQAAEILRGASTLPPAARATFMSEVDGIFAVSLAATSPTMTSQARSSRHSLGSMS